MIIMQMQYSKNLNPEGLELRTTLSQPNRSIIIYLLLFYHG